MSTVRRLASRLLNGVVQHSSPQSRCWGDAMLRELDFVESDWAALFWALGSTTALCRHSVPRQVKALLSKPFSSSEQLQWKKMARKTTGILSGIAVAGGFLTLCVLALLGLMHSSWWQLGQGRLAERLLVVVIPESVYIASIVALWRQRRSVALGIVLASITLITHVIIHFATHG